MALPDSMLSSLQNLLRDAETLAQDPNLEPVADVVALMLDVHAHTCSWVKLVHTGLRGPPPDAETMLGLLSASATELVHPVTYTVVQHALGLDRPLAVAPYELKRSFRGARVVLWTRDDNPKDLPAVRFTFNGASGGSRWLGNCFLVAYPERPKQQAPAARVPGTSFATRAGDDAYVVALDTRAVLAESLRDGSLGVEWVSQAEASATPAGTFSLGMNLTPASDGAVVMSTTTNTLKYQCAVCNAPCSKFCNRCGVVNYCSVECQKGAWKTHKLLCKPRKNDGSAKR
jgi:hypothetical protein